MEKKQVEWRKPIWILLSSLLAVFLIALGSATEFLAHWNWDFLSIVTLAGGHYVNVPPLYPLYPFINKTTNFSLADWFLITSLIKVISVSALTVGTYVLARMIGYLLGCYTRCHFEGKMGEINPRTSWMFKHLNKIIREWFLVVGAILWVAAELIIFFGWWYIYMNGGIFVWSVD